MSGGKGWNDSRHERNKKTGKEGVMYVLCSSCSGEKSNWVCNPLLIIV